MALGASGASPQSTHEHRRVMMNRLVTMLSAGVAAVMLSGSAWAAGRRHGHPGADRSCEDARGSRGDCSCLRQGSGAVSRAMAKEHEAMARTYKAAAAAQKGMNAAAMAPLQQARWRSTRRQPSRTGSWRRRTGRWRRTAAPRNSRAPPAASGHRTRHQSATHGPTQLSILLGSAWSVAAHCPASWTSPVATDAGHGPGAGDFTDGADTRPAAR